jgi:hypothetical protein
MIRRIICFTWEWNNLDITVNLFAGFREYQ